MAITYDKDMTLSLKGERLKRYRDIAALFMKYGRGDLVRGAGMEDLVQDAKTSAPGEAAKADDLAADLEKMGPTFIKLGQLLSTRADLLPMPYMEALARLQDNVGPFPYLEAEAVITSELGVRLSKAFSEFARSRWPRRRWGRSTARCCATGGRSRSTSNARASASA